MIVPIYQAESKLRDKRSQLTPVSPADHRGFLGALEFTGNIIGYSSSVWIDYACSYIQSDWSWRLPLSIQVIGGVVLALGSFVCPESPRYLVDTDHDDEGIQVIADFKGKPVSDAKVQEEYQEIREGVLADVSCTIWSQLTPSVPLVIAHTGRSGRDTAHVCSSL
jgi:hypothetical protein